MNHKRHNRPESPACRQVRCRMGSKDSPDRTEKCGQTIQIFRIETYIIRIIIYLHYIINTSGEKSLMEINGNQWKPVETNEHLKLELEKISRVISVELRNMQWVHQDVPSHLQRSSKVTEPHLPCEPEISAEIC